MSSEFELLLRRERPDWGADRIAKLNRFRNLVLAENEIQNLTRITEPEAFFDSHVVDGEKLLESGLLEFPAMDLGSGAGVPGIVCAILQANDWVLLDSERRKADFLQRAAGDLGLSTVRVAAERGENWLKGGRVKSIVSRAVGPVDRIYGWLKGCSTWNNLVLLKSRSWDDEWKAFQTTPSRGELRLDGAANYVSPLGAPRRIIRLARVPRGTNSA